MRNILIALCALILLTACSSSTATPGSNTIAMPLTAGNPEPESTTEGAYPPSEPQDQALDYPAPQEVQTDSAYPAAAAVNNSSRYGIPAVDRILNALFDNPTQLEELVVFTIAPCTQAEGLGGPPKCAPGESEGAEIEVLPILGSEGSFLRKGQVQLTERIGQANLMGVFQVQDEFVSEQYYPAGEYGIVLMRTDGNIVVLRITQDGIVRLDTPAQIPGKEQRDLAIYLNPQP